MGKILYAWYVVCIIILIGCAPDVVKEAEIITVQPQTITATQAKELMADGGAYILADVRTPQEFEEERIAGAVLMPVDQLRERAEAEWPEKDARIFVYCRSGGRSANAAQTLAEMGFLNVYDLGGILDWPYELER